MKRDRTVISIVLILSIILSTFGVVAAAPAPKSQGILMRADFSDPLCLVPFMHSDTASSDICDLIYSSLLKYDKNLNLSPEVAEALPTVSKDGKTITFKLKKGVLWHDGVELTSADIKFTYDLIRDPAVNSDRMADFEIISRIDTPDKYTVAFILKNPSGVLLDQFQNKYLIPKHLYEKEDKTKLKSSKYARNPVGCGAFKFVEWKNNERVTLEGFDKYFDGKPGFEKYIFDINPSQATAMVKVEKGEANMVQVPESDVARMSKLPNLNVNRYVGNVFDCVLWNTKTSFFSDKKVRQAMTHAINKNAIVSGIYKGNGKPAVGSVVPALPFYNKNAKDYKYSIATAKKLLDEAGWKVGKDGIREKNGKKFKITMLTNKGNIMREKLIVEVQRQLRQVGIVVEPRIIEWNTFITQYLETGNFDAYVGGFTTGLDADHRAFYYSDPAVGILNRGGYSNPSADKVMDEIVITTDMKKQKELMFKLQEIVAEDQPMTFIIYRTQAIALNKNVKNAEFYDLLNWHNPEKCWVE